MQQQSLPYNGCRSIVPDCGRVVAMNEWAMKPKRYVPDLRQLGALCEGNYHRIERLRQLRAGDQPVCDIELHRESEYLGRVRIKVLQTARYTETLLLEQIHNRDRKSVV